MLRIEFPFDPLSIHPPEILVCNNEELACFERNELADSPQNASLNHVGVRTLSRLNHEGRHVIPLYHVLTR